MWWGVGVSAINDTTIASNKSTELEFLVNGTDKVTATEFAEKYEGYSVTFLYNKSGAAYGANGTVNVATAGTFKYAVQVTDPEGNKIPEAPLAKDFAEVKVVDATDAVKVSEVALYDQNGDKWENNSVLESDNITIDASVFENALGQKNTDKDAAGNPIAITSPTVKTAVSSDPTVAYYENGTIKVLKDGTVTFTVSFVDLEDTAIVTVNAKKEQKATSIDAKAQTVKAAEAQNLVFKVLDQDGEVLRDASKQVFYTVTKKGENEATSAVATTATNGEVTLSQTLAEGEYTVNVYDKATKDKKFGTFTVKAVDIQDSEIDKYTLSFANEEETKLDLNTLLDPAKNSLNIEAKAFIDSIEVPLSGDLVAKSSNEDVATVDADALNAGEFTVTAGTETGTATITLYTKEEALLTPVATLDVTVENTSPQVSTLTLKKDTKVDAKAADEKQAVVDAVKEDLVKEQIESVTKVAANGVVIVKIANEFGGQEFVLDAKFDDVTLDTAVITVLPIKNVDAVDASVVTVGESTFTFGTEYTNADTLVTAINGAGLGVTAENVEGTVTVKADATGVAGNSIVLNEGTLAGGADLVPAVDASEVTVANETFTFDSAATELDANKYSGADDLVAKIIAKNLGVTASNLEGTVTVTADEVGASGNAIVLNEGTLSGGDDSNKASGTLDITEFSTAAEEEVAAKAATGAFNIGDFSTEEVTAVTPVDGELVLTFSDAVTVEAGAELTLTVDATAVTATVASVSEGKTEVNLTIDSENADVVTDTATIENVTGLTAANGSAVVVKDVVISQQLAQ
ncbi:flagellin hook IN domain protein subfamily [Sporosarcina newyorkensis 2681]|uniref:Flagellin hook IN domain protein subfamily n=1 Tax=Sporosarcina newyorkensis 2681 TaxID=1027292 RepID=F9DR03_9BACL|nr:MULTISPECIES: hypothetical protein [Sporosarcina]EGQ26775.1 flagellin hook IN domain protein subfamily [Sporosarcina newyorkensis 2681]MBY0221655.1 hypothetical protein [Sporosarcina aquimarina]